MSNYNSDILEPDEQFISALEDELRQGIRRRALLDSTNHYPGAMRRKGMKMLATVSLMVLSLMLGAAGTFTVVHEDPAPQRELHVQKASILLERAQLRLEQRRATLIEALSHVERGLINKNDAARYRQMVWKAGLEVQRRELELKETSITGRPAVDDLTGPLIAGEDFIIQRLELRRQMFALDFQTAKDAFARMEALVQRGAVSERELSPVRAELEEAEQAVAGVEERISLRRSFLIGEMAAEQVELRAMSREAEGEYVVAKTALEAAQVSLQRIASLHEAGLVTSGELRSAEAAVREAESDLALAKVQLTMIRQRLEALEQAD
ncbi:MAG: hypothetical protein JSV91_06575 [Phycisphaerales bacterium]|nr:MAG: hypothetical protein JSV91_06575 [Phycisphaerales bacterium]